MNEKTGNLTEKKKTHTRKKQMKVLKIKISEV